MIYVGVKNSRSKSRIAGRPPARTIYVNPDGLAWDCQRHIAFLRTATAKGFAKGISGWDDAWMLCSAYAGWLLQTGRTEASALERCRLYLAHFAHVQAHGVPGPWATVTEDGLRLDGSHRAAIAVVLGHELVPVAVVPYLRTDWAWRHQWRRFRERRIQEGAMHSEVAAGI